MPGYYFPEGKPHGSEGSYQPLALWLAAATQDENPLRGQKPGERIPYSRQDGYGKIGHNAVEGTTKGLGGTTEGEDALFLPVGPDIRDSGHRGPVVDVTGYDALCAQPSAGHRQHARAAPHVQPCPFKTARPCSLGEELQAETGRWMGGREGPPTLYGQDHLPWSREPAPSPWL